MQAAAIGLLQTADPEPGRVRGDDLQGGSGHRAVETRGIQVQPRDVQNERIGGVGMLVQVQRCDQPAGGVGQDEYLVVGVGAHGGQSGGEVFVVDRVVIGPSGGAAGADGAAVVAQVNGEEVVTVLGPGLCVVCLKEVVGETVDIQHGTAAPAHVAGKIGTAS